MLLGILDWVEFFTEVNLICEWYISGRKRQLI